MCGIAGCVTPPGRAPDPAALARMAERLHHRGPDDRGIEVHENAGLVSTRLAIIDPSPRGHEPMSDPSGRWWVSYNGEVFNHAELRRELGDADYRGGSDTETLVHAWARWGKDAVARCNGFFAYAALDRERRRLYLVRDRFGVKPLYWARHDGCLWFGSEIGALLAGGVPRELDRGALVYALLYAWASGPVTPVEGVRRVLPGTMLEVDLDTLEATERRWYHPADDVDAERIAALARRPRGELVDLVESELRASVRRRLLSDVPVGTMCSGGLDSSLVTAFAREADPGIAAYNAAITDQPEADESRYARQVTDALGVKLRTVEMTAADWRRALVSVVEHNEYPLAHESSVPMMQIAELARGDGVKVLLSGEGADELFGGYGHMHVGLHLDYIRRHRRVRAGAALLAGKLRRDGVGATARRVLDLVRSTDPAAGRGGADRPGLRDHQFPGLVPSAEAAESDQDWTARALAAYADDPDESRRRLQAELLRELGTYLPHLLNRQDKNTMQRSIETREPYLDPGLVALALNLPPEVKLDPQRKAVLRAIGRRHIPRAITRRPKFGFGFDVPRYVEPAAHPEFMLDGMLREIVEAPREEWRAVLGGTRALALWTGEIWCRLVLDGQPAAEVEAALWRDPDAAPTPSR